MDTLFLVKSCKIDPIVKIHILLFEKVKEFRLLSCQYSMYPQSTHEKNILSMARLFFREVAAAPERRTVGQTEGRRAKGGTRLLPTG